MRFTSYPAEQTELRRLKDRIDALDTIAESRMLTSPEIKERNEGNQKILDMEKLALLDIKQKARIRWAMDRDENTRFFHGLVNNRNRKNNLNGLTINGQWCTDAKTIKAEVLRFYENKL